MSVTAMLPARLMSGIRKRPVVTGIQKAPCMEMYPGLSRFIVEIILLGQFSSVPTFIQRESTG